MNGRDVDVDDLIGISVIESVVDGNPTGRGLGGGLIGEHVAGTGERGSVRSVLLVTPLHEHHADIEGERGDDKQCDQPPGEQDEDLTRLASATRRQAPSC